MRRLLLVFLILIAGMVAMLAQTRPAGKADLSISNGIDVSTLDPQRMSWTHEIRLSRLIFEGLVANDVFTNDYRIIPAVATSWEISDDKRTYTFHLRKDARWSNGEPVRAGDFLFAWRRAMLPDTAADYFMFFEYIQGVDEFFAWRLAQLKAFPDRTRGMNAEQRAAAAKELWDQTLEKFDELVQAKALDDQTLTVTLKYPIPFFLDMCAFASYFPVYPPLVSQYEQVDPQTGRINARGGWTKPPHVVTNGPFMLTRWHFKRDMRFEQNPYYWNKASLNVRSIEMPSIADPNAQVLAYQTGAVDYVADVTAAYRREMAARKLAFYKEHWDEYQKLKAQGYDPYQIDRMLPADPRNDVHITAAFGTYFWNFNCQPTLPDGRPNPMADARVRRAFAMMVDKAIITEEVRGLGEPVARTLIPPGSIGGYTSPHGLDCLSDMKTPKERQALIAKAKALLAEAGYEDPASMPTIELEFNKDSGHDLIAQAIANSWKQTLGVSVRLVQKELAVFRDDLKKHNFITARAGWYGDYPDPLTFLEINRTGDGNNDRAFSNETYDAMLDQAYTITDPAKRSALLTRAEAMIVEDQVPMIPIFHYVNVVMFDAKRLSGPNPHPRSNENYALYDILGDGIGSDTVRMMPRVPTAAPPTTRTPAATNTADTQENDT